MIDEFPFFSFLLGDVHPHVLALPFVLLGLALALNVYFGVMRARSGSLSPDPVTGDGSAAFVRSSASGLWTQLSSGFRRLVSSVFGGWFEFFLVALCLGALGFLNTWDFPIYLGVLAAALALARARRGSPIWLGEAVAVGAGLGLLGGVYYLPFYVGFQSQVGGLLPNLFSPTRLRQFLVFFGPFLFVIVELFDHSVTPDANARPAAPPAGAAAGDRGGAGVGDVAPAGSDCRIPIATPDG